MESEITEFCKQPSWTFTGDRVSSFFFSFSFCQTILFRRICQKEDLSNREKQSNDSIAFQVSPPSSFVPLCETVIFLRLNILVSV